MIYKSLYNKMCNPANFITINQSPLADPALTNEDEYFEDEEEYDEYNEFADGHMDRLIDQHLDQLEEQAWSEEVYILEGLYLAVSSGEGLDEAVNAARAFGMSEEAIDEEVSKLRRDKEEDPMDTFRNVHAQIQLDNNSFSDDDY